MKKWIAMLLCALTLFSSFALAETLPVYQALARTQDQSPFFDQVDPGWFNTSGKPGYENASKHARYDIFTFPDGAQLNVDTSSISYTEYDGEYYMIYGENPQNPGGPFPRPSFAAEIGRVAFDQLVDMIYGGAEAPMLVQQELNGISLAEAKDAVESLLKRLNLNGYRCALALDMSAERIRDWGSAYVEKHKTYYNVYDRYYDFSKAAETDEGYYLIYELELNGLPAAGNPDGYENVQAFVNASGVVTFELRSSYAIGDLSYVPETLLTQDEIRTIFEGHNERRIQDGFLNPTFTGAQLKYCPMRAKNKTDGMVYAPAWHITYDFLDGTQPCSGWAWYSALDGKLIMDCYS